MNQILMRLYQKIGIFFPNFTNVKKIIKILAFAAVKLTIFNKNYFTTK